LIHLLAPFRLLHSDLAVTGGIILVECSKDSTKKGNESGGQGNDKKNGDKKQMPVAWTIWNISALPTVTEMRQLLCRSLLSACRTDSISSDSSSSGSAGGKLACATTGAPCPTHELPRRQNSGAVITA